MALTNAEKLEIQRKVKNRINLTNPSKEAVDYYNQVKSFSLVQNAKTTPPTSPTPPKTTTTTPKVPTSTTAPKTTPTTSPTPVVPKTTTTTPTQKSGYYTIPGTNGATVDIATGKTSPPKTTPPTSPPATTPATPATPTQQSGYYTIPGSNGMTVNIATGEISQPKTSTTTPTKTPATPTVTPTTPTVTPTVTPTTPTVTPTTPVSTTQIATPQSENTNVPLSDLQKTEIKRKAELGIPLTNPTEEATAYYNQVKPTTAQRFQNLLSASKQKTISDLNLVKQQALAQVGQQQSQLTPQYEALRSQAAAQSMQQARNLAEYMAARGQTMSGLAAQSELSRGMGLTRQLGQIGQQQQIAQQDLANRKSMIEQDYLSKVANAQSDFELKQLEKAYTDAIKAEDRAYQEQKTAEERIYQQGLKSQQLSSEQQQKTETQKQSNILNSVIDKIRKGEIYVQGVDVPGLGSLPSQTRILTKEEIASGKYVDYIINNANQLRTNYGDAGYELLLKTARDEMKMSKPASSLSSVQYDPSTGKFAISQ